MVKGKQLVRRGISGGGGGGGGSFDFNDNNNKYLKSRPSSSADSDGPLILLKEIITTFMHTKPHPTPTGYEWAS